MYVSALRSSFVPLSLGLNAGSEVVCSGTAARPRRLVAGASQTRSRSSLLSLIPLVLEPTTNAYVTLHHGWRLLLSSVTLVGTL